MTKGKTLLCQFDVVIPPNNTKPAPQVFSDKTAKLLFAAVVHRIDLTPYKEVLNGYSIRYLFEELGPLTDETVAAFAKLASKTAKALPASPIDLDRGCDDGSPRYPRETYKADQLLCWCINSLRILGAACTTTRSASDPLRILVQKAAEDCGHGFEIRFPVNKKGGLCFGSQPSDNIPIDGSLTVVDIGGYSLRWERIVPARPISKRIVGWLKGSPLSSILKLGDAQQSNLALGDEPQNSALK